MLKQKYFTGVDGGGTQSRGLVMDRQGQVICQLQGESSNVYKLGVGKASSNLAELISRIAAKVPDFRQYAAGICCGLAGVIEGRVQVELREAIRQLGAGESVNVHNDAYLSCFGVASGKPAIALISGTGSVAFAFDGQGRVVTAGGMGYLYGDEGSGFEIGSQGVRAAVACAENRGPATALLLALLDQYALQDISDLPIRLDSAQSVSRFAETVHYQALAGDAVAIAIIDQASRSLVNLVSAVLAKSDFKGVSKLPVGLFGGCLENMNLLRSRVRDQLAELGLELQQHIPSPELIAAQIARENYLNAQSIDDRELDK